MQKSIVSLLVLLTTSLASANDLQVFEGKDAKNNSCGLIISRCENTIRINVLSGFSKASNNETIESKRSVYTKTKLKNNYGSIKSRVEGGKITSSFKTYNGESASHVLNLMGNLDDPKSYTFNVKEKNLVQTQVMGDPGVLGLTMMMVESALLAPQTRKTESSFQCSNLKPKELEELEFSNFLSQSMTYDRLCDSNYFDTI